MTAAAVASQPAAVAGAVGQLEAAVDSVADGDVTFACVVCHPHPLHDGTMHNKVVTTVARAAARLGGIVLRFNYRGVGESQGAYDGERGELEDALAAIRHLRAMPSAAHLPLVIAGFSFGGAIAYRAAIETDCAALITVAPAHERIPSSSIGSFARWLLIQGNDDEVIPAAGVLQWAREHTPLPEILQIEATGHFFHGRLSQLAESVSAYLRQR